MIETIDSCCGAKSNCILFTQSLIIISSVDFCSTAAVDGWPPRTLVCSEKKYTQIILWALINCYIVIRILCSTTNSKFEKHLYYYKYIYYMTKVMRNTECLLHEESLFFSNQKLTQPLGMILTTII